MTMVNIPLNIQVKCGLINWCLQAEQKYRTERDTFGDLQVPSDRYWGAQTQRYASSLKK